MENTDKYYSLKDRWCEYFNNHLFTVGFLITEDFEDMLQLVVTIKKNKVNSILQKRYNDGQNNN